MRPAPARRGARAQQYMPAFRFHRRLRSAQKRALHAGPARQISRSNPVVRYCSMPGTTTWHWTCAPESRWHVLRSRRGKHMPGPIRCHGPFPQNRTARLRVSLLASFQQVPRRTSAIPAPHFGTSRAVLRQVPHRTSASPAPHFGKSRTALRQVPRRTQISPSPITPQPGIPPSHRIPCIPGEAWTAPKSRSPRSAPTRGLFSGRASRHLALLSHQDTAEFRLYLVARLQMSGIAIPPS